MIPIKQFQVDFTPQSSKKQQNEKNKVKGITKDNQKDQLKSNFKKKRPLTGKVQAFVQDSKSMLQRMMKTNKSSIKTNKILEDAKKQSNMTKDQKGKKKQIERSSKNIQKQKEEEEQEEQNQEQQRQDNNKVKQEKYSNLVTFNASDFLKTQKQKQKNYAKQLQKQFQASKQQRMSKLYKRQKQANNKISQTKVQVQTQHKYYDQLPILLRYPVETSNEFILQTHQTTKIKQFISFINKQQLRQNDKQSFDDQYKWEKIQKICDDYSKLTFVNIRDNQIRIKNQFVVYPNHDNLLNVMALISTKPQLLKKLTLYHQQMLTQKVYPFLLYKNNKKLTVIVDNQIQAQESEFGPIDVYSHTKNKNTMWVSLFQKAYRKLFKTIGTLHQVTNNILNTFPEVIKISSNAVIKQNLFQVLRFHFRNGGLIGLIRKGDIQKSNSYQGRVYPVKQVRIGKTFEESSLHVINPWYGKSLLSDGRQHLNPKQIFSHFNRIILIKDYPSLYVGIQQNINMYSFGIPASNNSQWVKNHQYLININKSSIFRIVLKRTDQYEQIFGFSLVKCEPEDTKISAINLDKLVTIVRSTLLNESSFTGYLQKGSYMILPFTHKRSSDSYVFLKLQIFTNNANNFSWGKSKIVQVEYKQIDRVKDKIEGDLEIIQKYQRPKSKPILQKGQKKYLPDQLTPKDIPKIAIQNAQYKPQDILVPGLAHKFIVRQNIIVEQKSNTNKETKEEAIQQNPEIAYQRKNQQLKLLLGIDAYTQEVDKQMFQQAIDHLDEEVDFNNYELGDEGFEKIIQYILEQPRITVLSLKGNELSDKSIVLLCYFLQKSDHGQLKKLNLADNLIGNMGFKALEGLSKRIKIKQIILTGNKGLKIQQIKRLADL